MFCKLAKRTISDAVELWRFAAYGQKFHFFDQSLHFCTSLHPKIDAKQRGQRLRKYTRWEALRHSEISTTKRSTPRNPFYN
jgi:hypothetical protein